MSGRRSQDTTNSTQSLYNPSGVLTRSNSPVSLCLDKVFTRVTSPYESNDGEMFTVATKQDTVTDSHGITPNLTNINFIFGTTDIETSYSFNKIDDINNTNVTIDSDVKINIEKDTKLNLFQISNES